MAQQAAVHMDNDSEAHVLCDQCPEFEEVFQIPYTDEHGLDPVDDGALDEAEEALRKHLLDAHGVEHSGPVYFFTS